MKQLLSSYADVTPPSCPGGGTEGRAALASWISENERTSGLLWAAMAKVLSAAIQLDLETPSWCHCRPSGDALANAIDTVLGALPPEGLAAFDKQQGA